MSELWLGLHNPDRHESCPWEEDEALCRDTSCKNGGCYREWPCRCCLAAEVEALRARVQAVRGVVEQVRRLAEDPIYVDSWDDWAVPSDDLRAILDGGDA